MPVLFSDRPRFGACPESTDDMVLPGDTREWDQTWSNRLIGSSGFEILEYQEPDHIITNLWIPPGRFKFTVEQTTPGTFGTSGIWHNWEVIVSQINAADPPFLNGFRFLLATNLWLITDDPAATPLSILHGVSRFDQFVDAAGTHDGGPGEWSNVMRPFWNYFLTDTVGPLDPCACGKTDEMAGWIHIEIVIWHPFRQSETRWDGEGTPPSVTLHLKLEPAP